MDQELDTDLRLSQYDPWVIKKNLTDSDTSNNGKLYLPREGIASIIPQMRQSMVQQMGTTSGVEVKVHIIDDVKQADDYTCRLARNGEGKHYFMGWGAVVRDNRYKTGDEIGLMWDQSYERFLVHKLG